MDDSNHDWIKMPNKDHTGWILWSNATMQHFCLILLVNPLVEQSPLIKNV